MSEDLYSSFQSQIERTMKGMIVPSIEKDDLMPVIGEKVKGSISSESENGIKTNTNASIECEEGSRITVIDGTDIQEKEDIVKKEMGYIYKPESRYGLESDFKENQEMAIKPENEVFQVVSVYAEDSTVTFVVEKQEDLEKFSSSISQSRNYTSEVKEMEEHHNRKIESSSQSKKRSGVCSENMKQEVIRKKEKCPKRNGKGGMKRIPEMNGRQSLLGFFAEAQNACQKNADGSKRKYTRSEMETMRFANVDEQRKIWREIYVGLGAVVSRELNGLAEINNKKFGRRNADHQQLGGKKNVNIPILGEDGFQTVEHNFEEQISGEMYNQNMNNSFEEMKPLNLACADTENHTAVEEEGNEDYDSDDEYDSIQRPAFYVEGDPDFDSGPPEDGLEYLRRVRWEAAQIPKVKIAKLQKTKINEQTVYMPNIPDIEQCPQHLQATKQWEDAFLTDFSKLRRSLSIHESSNFQSCNNPQLVLPVASDDSSNPTLSLILGMDSVSRASMLRKRINSFETKCILSRNECVWLFALCAAVDIPFDADMSASMRCLLRKCANLRAGKSEFDDEVVMLNMLVTISGRFFGQLE